MSAPDVGNRVGEQLHLDAEGHIIGLPPTLPPVPELVVGSGSTLDSSASPEVNL